MDVHMSGFYTHPASVDASLHLSAVKPLGTAIPEHPDVPVGMSGFCGPASHSVALAGMASADVATGSQPLTWQADPDASATASQAGKAPSVILHGLQTKPMGAMPAPADQATQVQLSCCFNRAWSQHLATCQS